MKTGKSMKDKTAKFRKAIGVIQSGASGQDRMQALERAVKAAPDAQTARSMSLLLSKERAVADMAAASSELGQRLRDLNASAEIQPAAIGRAAAPAIANAQRPMSPSQRRTQRQVLRDAYTGDYRPASLPRDETELASQTRMARESERRIAEAEANLAKAATPEARAEWGMRLTREKLIQGHREGVI